ncbi:MAG: four helix bundle protein [Chloroflexota bacterium]|nr:four helix bundle protein [Anaerolineae bacterium]
MISLRVIFSPPFGLTVIWSNYSRTSGKVKTTNGANYREANRAESRNDFIHKIAVVEKEVAETQYWLELFEDACIGDSAERRWLLQECGELLAILVP